MQHISIILEINSMTTEVKEGKRRKINKFRTKLRK